VNDAVNLGDIKAFLFQKTRNAVQNGFAGIVGRRQQLAGVDDLMRGIMQNEIGEGAADIDADANATARIGHLEIP
jgi:hypothetical protein